VPEIIIGRNPVLESLRAGRKIAVISIERSARSDERLAEIERLARANQINCTYVTRGVLDAQTRNAVHQGVVAVASSRPSISLQDLAAIPARNAEVPLFVVLDGIEDPHNLGAILRTCEATGVHGVVTRFRRAVGLTPAAIKAAAGAAEYVPLVEVTNVAQSIEVLKKKNVWIVGIEGSTKGSYLDIDYRPPTAIVVGAEGQGISALVRKRCDFVASIPMHGKITSLNASVATGVVLYEVVRQRDADRVSDP